MNKLRNDLILIVSILAICIIALILFFTLSRGDDVKALVYRDDDLIMEIDLEKDDNYTVEGEISNLVITVSSGKLSVVESGCEDKICIHQGSIDSLNETITCLPNKVYIKIASDKEGVDVTI